MTKKLSVEANMDNTEFISVIIPCRNEEKFIDRCLSSIVEQDYPKDKLEVLVVDGISDDNTREIVARFCQTYPFIKLLDNPQKITPTALNIGIKRAKGEKIIRMDAHCTYKTDYISKCVSYSQKYNADHIGGVQVHLPFNDTALAKSIALATSHPFGVGNCYFRIGSKESKYVNAAYCGCFRKEVFDKIGLFDEELVRNQDDEFDFRIIKNGGKVMLAPEIVSYYYTRDTIRKLSVMYFQYGYFKPLVAKKLGDISSLRQIIPALFVGALTFAAALSLISKYFLYFFLTLACLYVFTNFVFSLKLSIKKGLKFLPLLFVSFTTVHISYGLGCLKGILDFLVFRKNLKNKTIDMPLTR